MYTYHTNMATYVCMLTNTYTDVCMITHEVFHNRTCDHYFSAISRVAQINCKERVKELEVKVAEMIMDYENGDFSTLELLELVDNIQRLGLGCRFQTNITRVLSKIAALDAKSLGLKQDEEEDNLHAFYLKFRILRQHDYCVSQGINF